MQKDIDASREGDKIQPPLLFRWLCIKQPGWDVTKQTSRFKPHYMWGLSYLQVVLTALPTEGTMLMLLVCPAPPLCGAFLFPVDDPVPMLIIYSGIPQPWNIHGHERISNGRPSKPHSALYALKATRACRSINNGVTAKF